MIAQRIAGISAAEQPARLQQRHHSAGDCGKVDRQDTGAQAEAVDPSAAPVLQQVCELLGGPGEDLGLGPERFAVQRVQPRQPSRQNHPGPQPMSPVVPRQSSGWIGAEGCVCTMGLGGVGTTTWAACASGLVVNAPSVIAAAATVIPNFRMGALSIRRHLEGYEITPDQPRSGVIRP